LSSCGDRLGPSLPCAAHQPSQRRLAALLDGQFADGDEIRASVSGDQIVFEKST
jgi:hypothetical protein